MKTDILIVGSGCSGLYAVLNLPDELDIMLITKSDFESSDSFLAQGGMCTLKDPSDYDSFSVLSPTVASICVLAVLTFCSTDSSSSIFCPNSFIISST